MTEKHGFPLANYDAWTLVYWLDDQPPNTLGAQVYEPLANAAVTAKVFSKALDCYLEAGHEDSLKSIQAFSEKPIAYTLMPRGPYKNVRMSDIPHDYFKTLIKQTQDEGVDRDFAFTIEQEAQVRLHQRYGHTGGLRKF